MLHVRARHMIGTAFREFFEVNNHSTDGAFYQGLAENQPAMFDKFDERSDKNPEHRRRDKRGRRWIIDIARSNALGGIYQSDGIGIVGTDRRGNLVVDRLNER